MVTTETCQSKTRDNRGISRERFLRLVCCGVHHFLWAVLHSPNQKEKGGGDAVYLDNLHGGLLFELWHLLVRREPRY